MLKSYNFWIGMSDDFYNELEGFLGQDATPPVQFPLLSNMSDETKDFFRALYDAAGQDVWFERWTSPAEKIFRMLSFYVNKPTNVTQVRSDIDAMESTYGQDFAIIGAWKCENGDQLGGNDTPLYPHPAFAINFMPDVVVSPGDPDAEPPVPPTYERPTQLSDVNLLAGQAKRVFGTL
jgi:hypothetical protein